MFRNLLRYWIRQSLEEAIRQKAAEMAASAGQSAVSAGQPGTSAAPPSPEATPLGCEAQAEAQKGVSREERPGKPSASTELQKLPEAQARKTVPSCDVGVVFALERESGGLEDLLAETGRWQGEGFVVIGGRLQERQVVIVRSGAGQTAAAHATEALLDGHRPRWVISAGFAGALRPELQRYDLLLPEAVLRPDGRRLELSPPEHWSAQTTLGPVHRGLLLSVDHLVSSPKEKHSLAEKYGAWAVDMETFAVVEVCRRRGVPVLAVRIVIDTADEHLPPEVRGLLKQKSLASQLGAALGALWHRPSSFKDLYRLKENALLASDRLARFLAWALRQLP
jgi:adenosylhomocysteine nucleosidase